MNIQYISDANGVPTGVFIPIEDWKALKEKHADIEDEMEIPDWHKAIVNERMEEYRKNPGIAQDFYEAMDELDNEI